MGDVREGSTASAPAASAPRDDSLIGRVINDRYEVLTLLARGGMGKVYAAKQAPLGRDVALKVLNPNYKGEHDPDFHRRFFLEAATCAKLTHPNTVTIFDYGRTDDDIYYIAMELLEGRTLHRALRDEGPLPVERALHIARQICRSLREAHAIHVVHRDLKPANIFLCRRDDDDDFVKVLDFGLVKNIEDNAEELTQTGLFMGSPKYMAPEQIQGEAADGRIDIYALGVILFEMLTGKVPFDRPSSVNILMAHVHDEPPMFEEVNPDVHVPFELEAVVRRCLAKSPIDRYATMDQVLAALKQVGVGASSDVSVRSGASRLSAEAIHASSDGETATITSSEISAPIGTPSGVVAREARAATPAADASEPASPRSGPPAWVYAGALGVVLAIGLGAAWFFSRSNGAAETPTAPTTPADHPIAGSGDDPRGAEVTATPRSGEPARGEPRGPSSDEASGSGASTEPPSTPAPVHVLITSIPSGASVAVGERNLGTTPIDMEFVGDDARPGTEHAFTVSMAGFQTTTVRRVVGGDALVIQARLARRPAGGMTARPETHVEGYRDDPYASP